MRRVLVLLLASACLPGAAAVPAAGKPNVLFIMSDDLNDYVESFGGHPQARTPRLRSLAESGVSFRQAHCAVPICNPSRVSLVSGLYPHSTGLYGFENWDENEVLRNSRTLMAQFRHHGYRVLGSGKFMHNRDRNQWTEYGHAVDYGPFAHDGRQEAAHPDVPAPFRDKGAVDGSFGPLKDLQGSGFSWKFSTWEGKREFRYRSDEDRDSTPDELSARWAVRRLRELAAEPAGKPFFMGVGFIRPHTPLIVPKKYFDLFPLESIQLPEIRPGDADDTHLGSLAETQDGRGVMLYRALVDSYGGDSGPALRRFIQAYLACVAALDDLVGEILDVVDRSPLRENTLVVFTSDHGWQMGQKDHLYKNSLWQESTRVPLIIRVPGLTKPGGVCGRPVSLVDLYPTLLDLCGLPADTVLNERGKPLDGRSLRPLLEDPASGTWSGPAAALTALYRWAKSYPPAEQSYALRSETWRYIRYANGKEELYDVARDPREWTNLASDPAQAERIRSFRQDLLGRLPSSPPPAAPQEADAEQWKEAFFKKHPKADADGDGRLSWPELKAYKARLDAGEKP